MSGPLNEPGTLTIEWLEMPEGETSEYPVASGPWKYADWLCWKPVAESTVIKYAPLANIATWSKDVATG